MRVRREERIERWEPAIRAYVLGVRVELWDGRSGEWMECFDQGEMERFRESGLKRRIMWKHREHAKRAAHRQRPPGGIARERAMRQEEEGEA